VAPTVEERVLLIGGFHLFLWTADSFIITRPRPNVLIIAQNYTLFEIVAKDFLVKCARVFICGDKPDYRSEQGNIGC